MGSALYIAGGIRGMERGTLSEERQPDGSETLANMELLRLALPRRVFTLSQVKYAIDRVHWLYENRELVGGLEFTEEPEILRFFYGRLKPVSDWQEKLVAQVPPGLRRQPLGHDTDSSTRAQQVRHSRHPPGSGRGRRQTSTARCRLRRYTRKAIAAAAITTTTTTATTAPVELLLVVA